MKSRLKVFLKAAVVCMAFITLFMVFMPPAQAVNTTDTESEINNLFGLLELDSPEGASTTTQIVILLTILSILPSILIMVTSFTRIIIVLSFMRNAIGVQQMPPNQVLVGLALFLTYFIMNPIFSDIYTNAYLPMETGEITFGEAVEYTVGPIHGFMYDQIRLQGGEEDLITFLSLADMDYPEAPEDIPLHVLIPSFLTSEIKTAFKIGFLIYVPFIVIDMVVASVLMSMGMMMLPPVMISLPFKIMLFVLVDGWTMTITSLVQTFSQ